MEISFHWVQFKDHMNARGILSALQFFDTGTTYYIYCDAGKDRYSTIIWQGDVPGTVIDQGYDQGQNDTDKAEFETNYKTDANKNAPASVKIFTGVNSAQQLTDDGKPIGSFWPSEGTKTSGFSVNWCDRTTWYSASIYVGAESPTPVVAGTTYQLAHANAIDMTHGKVPFEDAWVDDSGRPYKISLRVDGTAKNEVDPHSLSGDYVVNYATGLITFAPPISPAAAVSVDYHYAVKSTYILRPDAGKILKIRRVKARLTEDVDMKDSMVFQLYVAGNPYGPASVYKTVLNVLSESDDVDRTFPVIGGASWRGNLKQVYSLQWDYLTMIELKSSYAMEVHVDLQHDEVFGGTYASAGFDCFVLNEQ